MLFRSLAIIKEMYFVALLSWICSSENAKEVFKKALDKQRPASFFTDGSFDYDDAFNKVFYSRHKTNRVEWIRRVGIKARETNNIVERLHGTLKDRLKHMRGLKKDKAAQTLVDGYVAYYNFCRKHQSIQKTPAQAAGLEEVKGWKKLINKAQIQKTQQDLKRQTSLEVKVIG